MKEVGHTLEVVVLLLVASLPLLFVAVAAVVATVHSVLPLTKSNKKPALRLVRGGKVDKKVKP